MAEHENAFDALNLSEAQRRLTKMLTNGGIESAAIDARILVTAALGLSKEQAILATARLIRRDEATRLAGFAVRRLAHEPVSRILARRAFYGRTFEVTDATLDPRPDSETLIEAAIELARERKAGAAPLRILDIGTGSGCLLLTLIAELPGTTGIGTDVSAAALDVARRNADALDLSGRVDWRQMRSLDASAPPFDLLISNPPYIPSAAIAQLAPDVRLYDPRLALDGGADGLQVYREILAGLAAHTSFKGAIFEVGATQADEVIALARETLGTRIQGVKTFRDLGGHTRCVSLRTHC